MALAPISLAPISLEKMSSKKKLKIIEEEEEKFDIGTYLQKLSFKIKDILLRDQQEEITYDILDTERMKADKSIALKVKQRQMKIGEIWQEVFGSYESFENLKVGHETGLDLLSHKRKIVIELKNRTNTDNASSKKTNFDKLARYKKEHPDYQAIYGTINADTAEKTEKCGIKPNLHNDVELLQYTGMDLLHLILGENTATIIEFTRTLLDAHA
jgi:hypothetical protein